MITRRAGDRWVLVRQHDHGTVSGEIAAHWGRRPVPGDDAIFAIAHHDVAWVGLDARARLADDGSPHSFMTHPLGPKYHAYRAGVDLAEDASAYAGWLCSNHYGRFAGQLDDELSARFVVTEAERRARLWPRVPTELQAMVGHDVDLLTFCDNLSLFLCLNEPGRNDWPWFQGGLRFGQERIELTWLDGGHVRVEPDPFDRPFVVSLPAWRPGRDGELVAERTVVVELGSR